jgi:hypothetical protein
MDLIQKYEPSFGCNYCGTTLPPLYALLSPCSRRKFGNMHLLQKLCSFSSNSIGVRLHLFVIHHILHHILILHPLCAITKRLAWPHWQTTRTCATCNPLHSRAILKTNT